MSTMREAQRDDSTKASNRFLRHTREFPLMMVTCFPLCKNETDFLTKIERACKAGLRVVQFRESGLEREVSVRLSSMTRAVASTFDATFIVNGDESLACGSGADGVHFKESNVLPFASPLLFGQSVHSLESAKRSEASGASYLIVGNIFATPSKQGVSGKGLAFLETICASVRVPVFAIGGIDANNAAQCIKAGASGVCAMTALSLSDNIEYAVRTFKRRLCSI